MSIFRFKDFQYSRILTANKPKRSAELYLAFFLSGCKQSNPSTGSKLEKKFNFYTSLATF